VCAGVDYSAIIDKNGKLFMFGNNSYEKLGLNICDIAISEPT
jgi:alpha-tubulin suppressor-like RCC1 family protein